MSDSIIKFFDSSTKLSYSFLSSKSYAGSEAKYALSKDGKRFDSDSGSSSPPYYWQISFPCPVLIDKYCICTRYDASLYVTKWEVSYSRDGKNFIPLQTDVMTSSNQNAVNYTLSRVIKCKHFKITAKETSTKRDYWIIIYQFDMFSPFLFRRNECPILVSPYDNVNRGKFQIIIILILIIVS